MLAIPELTAPRLATPRFPSDSKLDESPIACHPTQPKPTTKFTSHLFLALFKHCQYCWQQLHYLLVLLAHFPTTTHSIPCCHAHYFVVVKLQHLTLLLQLVFIASRFIEEAGQLLQVQWRAVVGRIA